MNAKTSLRHSPAVGGVPYRAGIGVIGRIGPIRVIGHIGRLPAVSVFCLVHFLRVKRSSERNDTPNEVILRAKRSSEPKAILRAKRSSVSLIYI
jgi:hypothetical protein